MGYIGAGISRFNTADELTVSGDATIDTTTLVVDSTNNRVGVGTASPTTALDVTGTVTADGLTVDGDVTLNDGSPNLRLQDTDTSRYIDMAYGTRVAKFTNTMASGEDIDTVEPWIEFSFKDDGETRRAMTIDHDGNLLVGTTSTISSNTNGGLYVSNNGYTSLFNRESAAGDGNIMLFAKGGTTVGSISTEGNDLAIGNADAGLQFVDGAERVRPFNVSTNAATDGLLDLGDSSKRFKDLYLSGGAYLGGTGSANHLDDYEEGTFTAGLAAGAGTITANTSHDLLSYIKIGNLVFISGLLIVGTFSGASNSLYITGLPFDTTAGTENSKLAAMSVAMQNLTSNTGVSLQAHVLADERILVEGFDGQTYNNIADHCGVGTQVRIGGCYFTG